MAKEKRPKKPRKHEDALDQGFCTSLRCRQYVLNGSGIQVWDEKKNIFRECVVDTETKDAIDTYLKADWEAKPHYPNKLFYFSAKTANRIIKKWFKAADISPEKAHWHTLRHTYVTQSLDRDIPLGCICEQTGDSPNTVIRVYGRPSIDKRREMAESKGKYWE